MEETAGLTTIHDMSLDHLAWLCLGQPADQYYQNRLLWKAHGAASLNLTDMEGASASGLRGFEQELSLLPIFVRMSLATITHSMTGYTRLSAFGSQPPYHIAHCYRPETEAWHGDRAEERALARHRLGIPADIKVIALAGFYSPDKQFDRLFEAVAMLGALPSELAIYVIGDPGGHDVRAAADRNGVGPLTHIVNYVDDAAFLAYLSASDILVNLRYPTWGETSGIVVNALSLGCCMIVTDVGTYSELPDDVAYKISVDDLLSGKLSRVMATLLLDEGARSGFEQASKRYAVEHLTVKIFEQKYCSAINATFQNYTIDHEIIS
jgi:glycosyltransferase involved in cell wall biosynthesis